MSNRDVIAHLESEIAWRDERIKRLQKGTEILLEHIRRHAPECSCLPQGNIKRET